MPPGIWLNNPTTCTLGKNPIAFIMWNNANIQYIDLLLVLAVGYALGRTVGYLMQERNERKWLARIQRLNRFDEPALNFTRKSGLDEPADFKAKVENRHREG